MPEPKKEYTLTDAPDRTKEQEKQEELQIPAYMTQVDLSDVQKKRLSKEFFKEYDAIDAEWQAEGLIAKFDALDNQYEGKLQQREDQQFNLHKHTTKVKVDTAVRYAKKAFLKSDPIYSVSPRPESTQEKKVIVKICEKQQDYLDYKLDEGEIPFKSPLGKVIHSSGVKGVGILKVPHEIKREKAKREEVYKGTPIYAVPMPGPGGQPELVRMTQEQLDKEIKANPDAAKVAKLIENQGLKDFLTLYPEAPEKYKGYVKKLEEGEEIRIVVTYEDVTYNDPLPKYVVLQNFRCRLAVLGYEGMKTTKLLSERMNYTWWELKKEEAKGKFFDIDSLKYEYEKGKAKKKNNEQIEKSNYANESFDVEEGVFYFKINKDDEEEEETKLRLWIEVESKKVIGVTLYPYYGVPCYWVPFYVLDKWPGWLQPSIAEYLTDTNIAENAFLNFMLEGLWASSMITPIVKEGSDAERQFLEKEWMHGVPITAGPKEIDFLQKYMKPPDVGGLVLVMNLLTRHGDDVSQVSSYTTGRESPIDPDAPMGKTLALLQQAGINIEEYIEALLPSFNEVGKIFLQLNYQMTKEGRKYRPRIKGADFQTIERSEMIARTNIQSQAMAFNFDKLNEKREDMALYQVARQEPLIARNPEAVWFMLKNLIKSWSPKWRNRVDELLPTLEELKREQLKVATMAMAQYVKAKAQEAKDTGKALEFDLKEIVALISEATAEIATPPPKEVQEEREKEAKNARTA